MSKITNLSALDNIRRGHERRIDYNSASDLEKQLHEKVQNCKS